MSATLERLSKSRIKLTIELSPDDMKPHLEKAAAELSKEYKIEGFRPGFASLGIVIQKLGAQTVWQHAAEHAVRKAYVQALMEHELMPIGQPDIQVVKLAADNPFVFTAETALLPDVTLGDYSHLKARRQTPKIEAAETDKAVEDLRSMFATENPVARAAQTGDKVEVDFDLFVDNVLVENGSSRQHPIIIGSGNYLPEFEQNIIGLQKDAKKDFSVTFPKDYFQPQVAGKTGTFKVTVKDVREIIKPELNDEFAKRAGTFATVAELRAAIEKNLTAEKETEEERKFERTILDELISVSKFGEIPESLIDHEVDKMLHELQDELMARGGLKFADYLLGIKKTEDDLKKDFRKPAETRVKSALCIRTIAKAESLTAGKEEIDRDVAAAKQQYAGNAEALGQIDTAEFRDYLASHIVNEKVVTLLKQRATDPAAPTPAAS